MDPTFWDERYSGETYAYGTEPNELLRNEASRIPKGRVLCLAEGEGRNAVFLAGLGYDVTAVDFSKAGLAKAERLAKERGVALTTVHADLATYAPPEGTFSGVIAIFAHLPPAVRKRVHALIPRVLAPGGVLVLEAYTPAQIPLGTGGPKDPAMTMTLDGLREELAPLTIVIGRELERDIQEGAFHSGPSATVQVVAKRT
ncbi:MAG: class I SAM-dependent methyltransferase [Myxococcales bacterium]|nr:class I SAM-dependent methyltransferase [Myxococcales bacterium]